MKKQYLNILMIILGLLLLGGGILAVRNISLFYYHGFKTSGQIQKNQVHFIKRNLDFNRIVLNANLPVIIKRGSTNQVRVVAQKRQRVHVEQRHHQLAVSSAPNVRDHPIAIRGFKQAASQLSRAYVMITVKKDQSLKRIERVNSETIGDITLQKISVGHLILNGSGNISLTHVSSKHQFLINNGRGNVTLNHTSATILNLTTRIGTIKVWHSRFKRKPSQIVSDSSDIDLKLVAWNGLWIKTNEGNVTFEHQFSKHLFKIIATDGNITGKIDKPTVAFIKTYSDNGMVQAFDNFPNDKARYYSFYTDNGNIKIKRGFIDFSKVTRYD